LYVAIIGLDTVAIVVSNRKKALGWYRDVLGLPAAYIGPNEPGADPNTQGSPDNPGHWIELGPGRPLTRIHLCELPNHQVEPGPTGITFLTNDIHTDYDRLISNAVHFLYAPKLMEWGEWLCEFTDPDGNQFDLKQWNPHDER
jgi:catechol 2,3-dioxygenase-like lactoylglutathione lyase family enzyme